MTQRITVVPAEGRAVPDPEAGDLLPAEGREVPDNAWWRRLERAQDVSIKDATEKTTPAARAAKSEEAQ
jgi:hypothetical protein